MRLALLLVCLTAPGLASAQPPTATDAAVWATVLVAAYPASATVTVADSTLSLARAPRSIARWLPRSAVEDTAAFRDMLQRNHQAVPIISRVRDSLARASASRAAGLSRYVRFALPGFNARGDIAFVYGQFTCGPGCGWDEGFVLELRDGAWVVASRRRYSVT